MVSESSTIVTCFQNVKRELKKTKKTGVAYFIDDVY